MNSKRFFNVVVGIVMIIIGEGVFGEGVNAAVSARDIPEIFAIMPIDNTLPIPSPEKPPSLADRLKVEVLFVTVDDLVRSPHTFLGRKVKVTGMLISTKEPFSPNPEFAITDRANSQILFKVTPWLPLQAPLPPPERMTPSQLPLEVPSSPPDSTQKQPRTMQSYLNRMIDLVGVVKQIEPSFYLEVSSGEFSSADAPRSPTTQKSKQFLINSRGEVIQEKTVPPSPPDNKAMRSPILNFFHMIFVTPVKWFLGLFVRQS